MDVVTNREDFDRSCKLRKRKLIDDNHQLDCKKITSNGISPVDGSLDLEITVANPDNSANLLEFGATGQAIKNSSNVEVVGLNESVISNFSSKSENLLKKIIKPDLSIETPPSSAAGSMTNDFISNGIDECSNGSLVNSSADCNSRHRQSPCIEDTIILNDKNHATDAIIESVAVNGRNGSEEDTARSQYNHLDLVWAKCPGFPFYPALVLL